MHATSLSGFSMRLTVCKSVTTGRNFDEYSCKTLVKSCLQYRLFAQVRTCNAIIFDLDSRILKGQKTKLPQLWALWQAKTGL